jgi:hypothetical protein
MEAHTFSTAASSWRAYNLPLRKNCFKLDSETFSRTLRIGMMPYRLRSSLNMTSLLVMLSCTPEAFTSLPRMRMLPESWESSPNTEHMTSVLPAPISPEKPMISPARAEKETFLNSRSEQRFSTSSNVWPIGTDSLG